MRPFPKFSNSNERDSNRQIFGCHVQFRGFVLLKHMTVKLQMLVYSIRNTCRLLFWCPVRIVIKVGKQTRTLHLGLARKALSMMNRSPQNDVVPRVHGAQFLCALSCHS